MQVLFWGYEVILGHKNEVKVGRTRKLWWFFSSLKQSFIARDLKIGTHMHQLGFLYIYSGFLKILKIPKIIQNFPKFLHFSKYFLKNPKFWKSEIAILLPHSFSFIRRKDIENRLRTLPLRAVGRSRRFGPKVACSDVSFSKISQKFLDRFCFYLAWRRRIDAGKGTRKKRIAISLRFWVIEKIREGGQILPPPAGRGLTRAALGG